jgi:16S rRNA (guanine1207-N2)-methyltransferase
VARREDPLLRGELRLRHHGTEVRLVPGEGVFSATAVDPGTRFLLRWLADDAVVASAARVLDVGCGYGPLGLWLAAASPERLVEAVDRDALALECTALGAAASGVAGRVDAHASLGFDEVRVAADLVVSNLPAKVGPAAMRHLVLDAAHHAAAAAVVVVARHAAEVRELLTTPGVEVVAHHANKGYATWSYRFTDHPPGSDAGSGFERGVYRRASGSFEAGPRRWTATTSYTLGEFDTLGHGTAAAVELLAARTPSGRVAFVGVGQGHVAVGSGSSSARLVDRDLLALRTAAANLAGRADVEVRHAARPAGQLAGCDAAVVALPEKEPVATTAALLGDAAVELPAGAPVVLHGRAVDVGRVLELLRRRGLALRELDRRARGGFAAAFTVTPPA